jgi:hypothetical protein
MKWPSNQALKLTRLSACQFGGPDPVETAVAHWLRTQSAARLGAGAGHMFEGGLT